MSLAKQLIEEMEVIMENNCKGWTSMKEETPDPKKYPYIKCWKTSWNPLSTPIHRYINGKWAFVAQHNIGLYYENIDLYQFWKPIDLDIPSEKMIKKFENPST